MIPEPDTRMREILSYLSYLSHTGLYISLHPCRPSSLLSRPEFLPYNLHRHPYCRYLKTNESLWRHCIARQEKVLRRAEQEGAFFGVCHAGMGEFVYPMTEKGQVIGFVSVSGYRGKEEITAPRRKALTWKYGFPASEAEATFQETVRQAPPSRDTLDAVIAPLLRMLEAAAACFPSPDTTYRDRKDGLYRAILTYLHTHRAHPVRVRDLCAEFHISPSFFGHFFKDRSGSSLSEYLRQLRLNDACLLLRTTDLPIGELAAAVGYEDAAYFSRVFRARYGIPPLAYRRAEKMSVQGGCVPD